jgi:HD-GYP domain-containing protein (c-di-GMP phosphodiesterase class II)
MPLLRLCTDQLQVGEPLPWAVYNEQSQLLLHQGYLLQDAQQLAQLVERGVYADQGEVARHERAQRKAARRQDAALLWADLSQRMDQLLGQPEAGAALAEGVGEAAEDLQHTVDHQCELALFEALQVDDPQSYAVSHALQTAFVANLVGTRLGWSDGERGTLTHAALTMNLGMMALQSQLSLQQMPLSSQQRQAVADHGRLSRALLERSGVTDAAWLHAVEHHHVTPHGGPLPPQHAQAGELACMLHYADVYLAKISARISRPALPSHIAARTVFVQTNGQHNPYVSALIKEIGVYPPGSCVRLASGELGIVVRRGEAAHQPEVSVLVHPKGMAYPEPQARDTAQPAFKVTDALPRGTLKKRLRHPKVMPPQPPAA